MTGAELKAARQRLGLSLAGLAQRLGLSPTAGERRLRRLEVAPAGELPPRLAQQVAELLTAPASAERLGSDEWQRLSPAEADDEQADRAAAAAATEKGQAE